MGDISGNQARKRAKASRLSNEKIQAKQRQTLAAQTAKEDARLAEASADIENVKERSKMKGKGRKSLIKSSPTGLATNLGGSNAGV